ncbi:MAG TPA: transcriptional regulator NrdR [Candidatus Nanoarchaeia archaeon]|nr:transcriptional regulator NrdR [Candidatus Nanoarchaeia archaeon]
MRCPYCNSEETKVIETREGEEPDVTRRRRECLSCSKRFTTYERVEIIELRVMKKNGDIESYNRNKIVNGILKACEKRPVKIEKVERIVDEIETELRKKESIEIPSKEIGEIVMDKLKGIDQVAYIRFASVYREFKDIKSFEKELEKIKSD